MRIRKTLYGGRWFVLDHNSLMPIFGNSGKNLVLLRFVNTVLGSSKRVRDVINQHFKILIWDGQDSNFWNDD